MKITEVIIRRPVSAIVIILGIAVFGIMSLFSMPQELTPEMEMPYLLVSTIYPGAGPEDVEKLVTREVEGAVGSLSGIKSVSSYSLENASLVLLQYEYGTNMDMAYTDTKEKLDRLDNTLPDTSQKPIVIEMNMNAMDTMSLSVRSSSGENMLAYIEEEIVPEFEKLSSVADVSVSGGQEEYVRIELMEERLQQYGITMNTVINSVSTADFSIPSGTADYGSQDLSVRSSVEYKTISALENIPIPLGGGNIIRMGDVAKVYSTVKDADSLSRYNGEDNISVGIQKRQSASAVSVSRQVRKVIDEINAENNDLHIDIVNDNSDTIQSSLSSVGTTLILSVFLSMLVLYIFLGDIKASLIVGSSMPVSLMVAFILMNMMGYTLNIVTMSSLVLGVGMMVDNSIVVLDSCFKSTTSKDSDYIESAIAGTKFVLGSIIGSTATTVVVFFPLATLAGMSGQMFGPLGFTIIFALVASLLSAMSLVPLFFVQFQPRERRTAPAALLLKKLERGYSRLLRKLLGKKKTVLAASLAMMAVAIFLGSQLNVELMSDVSQGIITISLDTRPGLKLEKIDSLVRQVETIVSQHPDVDHYTITAGGSGMNALMGSGSASVTAYLKDKQKMETDDVIEQWRRETKHIRDCDIEISATSMMSMTTDTVEVNLQGSDLDVLREFVGEVVDVFHQNPDIITVTSTVADPSPQAEIVVDPMKAAAYNLTPMQVATNVNMALSGKETVKIRQNDQDYAIFVEYPPGKYNTVSDLYNMLIVSNTGSLVALNTIASIEFTDTPQTILREDNQYIVTVTGTPTVAAKFTAPQQINAAVAEMEFPKGVELARNTQDEMMMEEFTALGIAIATAVLLVFMVMAIQFESVKHSLMVMICIPFSMIGSFIFMFIAGTTVSMTSLLGFLILVGTVVNNGILFVDSTNEYRKSMSVETALISTGRNRLRPILMTTLTTVLSMLPLSLGIGDGGEMMQGLGIVVIGGLIVSTLLTLLLLPTFYLMIDGNSEKKERRRQKRLDKQRKRRDAQAQDEYGYHN